MNNDVWESDFDITDDDAIYCTNKHIWKTRPWYREYPNEINKDVESSYATWDSVVQKLEERWTLYADQIAFTCMGTDITYKELNKKADYFAGFLND